MAVELEFLEQLFERREIRLLRLDHLDRKLDGHRGFDGREALAQQYALAIILQTLAVHLALDLGGTVERGFH